MNEKYLLDGEAVHWESLIIKACEYDTDFSASFIKTTRRAATILRENGHTVEKAGNTVPF